MIPSALKSVDRSHERRIVLSLSPFLSPSLSLLRNRRSLDCPTVDSLLPFSSTQCLWSSFLDDVIHVIEKATDNASQFPSPSLRQFRRATVHYAERIRSGLNPCSLQPLSRSILDLNPSTSNSRV